MPRLWLKLFRDIVAYRSQAIGIGVMVMLGLSMYHSFYLSYRSMAASYKLNYSRLALADFTVEMGSAPEETITRLGAIPGVRAIAGRIKQDVRIEQVGGRRRTVTGRILSVPNEGRSLVDKVVVLQGRYLGPPDQREVLLERGFAEAHKYRPGETIFPVVNGVRQQFTIAGIVSSPDDLYAVRSKESLFPSPDSFGVMWMRRRRAERLFGMDGLINQVAVLTAPGQRTRVMDAMYADLRRFGAQLPVPQEDQPSRSLLDSDLRGLGQFAIIFPSLFIGSAALTIYSVVARTVQRERRQVGFLRASGLPAWRVGLQYVAFAGLLGIAGAIPGVLLGQWFALGITGVYLGTLGIPYLELASGVRVGLLGVAVTLAACVVAGLRPSLAAAALLPADAMRSESVDLTSRRPPAILQAPAAPRLLRGADRAEQPVPADPSHALHGAWRRLRPGPDDQHHGDAGRAGLRHLVLYFGSVRNYDVDVGFAQPVSATMTEQVRSWPGVEWAEGTVGLPVRLSHGGKVRDTVLTGVPLNSRLQRFRDLQGDPLKLRGDRIYPARARPASWAWSAAMS